MRGIPRWNFDEFDRVAKLLRTAGWQVFNPAEHDRAEGLDENDYPELPDWFTLEKALQWDFARIIEAGNICLLDGWETSSGAAKELRVAEDIGARVWRAQGETLVEWNYDLVRELQGMEGVGFKGSLDGVQWSTDPGPQVAIKTSEHRVTSSTGGEKGSKLARFDLLPPDALKAVAEHYGRNTTEFGGKYGDRNWEKAYPWHLSFASLQRHAQAWWSGEELDEEDQPHVAAMAWHALALLTFSLRGIGEDDRHVISFQTRVIGNDDRSPRRE
jgi:hypothetical protein